MTDTKDYSLPYDDSTRKFVYEWVLVMNKGDDMILTENQYEFYKENFREKKIFLADLEINPGFVVAAFKREAIIIKKKYPCKTCHSCGRPPSNDRWCENCGGSGVDLPKA